INSADDNMPEASPEPGPGVAPPPPGATIIYPERLEEEDECDDEDAKGTEWWDTLGAKERRDCLISAFECDERVTNKLFGPSAGDTGIERRSLIMCYSYILAYDMEMMEVGAKGDNTKAQPKKKEKKQADPEGASWGWIQATRRRSLDSSEQIMLSVVLLSSLVPFVVALASAWWMGQQMDLHYFATSIILPLALNAAWLVFCSIALSPNNKKKKSTGSAVSRKASALAPPKIGSLRLLAAAAATAAAALLPSLALASYDVCLAPTDCHELTEEEVPNVDVGGLISALPQCIFLCIAPAGIDVQALMSTMELPECREMSGLMTCAVDICDQDAISKTQFCLLQSVLKNACLEDFDAGVVYEDGSAPIVD
ncbi:hypothetical protein TeGR_g12584, partial [Tetraparma gracilis]